MNMAQYSVYIQYDTTDQIYVASIPELKGCMAHGATKELALKELEKACLLWLDTAQDLGLNIPEPILFSRNG